MTRVAACQVPDVRGDVDGALGWIERFGAQATRERVRLLVFPEGFLQGYSTQADAVRRDAIDLTSAAFADVLRRLTTIGPMLVFGVLERDGERCFNSAVVVRAGELLGVYRKTHLFGSELRAFEPGDRYPIFEVDRLRFGINICYDTNFTEASAAIAAQEGRLIVCPANNMLRLQTAERCREMHNSVRLERVRETGLWLLSADVTGSTESRVSYGPTAVLHPSNGVLAQVPLMTTGMVVADIGADGTGVARVLSDERQASATT